MTFDETVAFLCAAKGEPYTFEEWDRHVRDLDERLIDAMARLERAREHGVCPPVRFEDKP